MLIIEDALDFSFDKSLIKTQTQKWIPWIGKNYQKSPKKVFVLGESHYKWGNTNTTETEILKQLNHQNFSRHVISYQALNHLSGSKKRWPIFRNLEKTIFNKDNITPSDKENLWFSVAYNNLVQRYMESIKHRPTYDDYYKGWKTLFQILPVLKPEVCLILGTEDKKTKSLETILVDHGYKNNRVKRYKKISSTYLKRIEIEKDNKLITELIFIQHPSKYFSWRKWALELKNLI